MLFAKALNTRFNINIISTSITADNPNTNPRVIWRPNDRLFIYIILHPTRKIYQLYYLFG